MKYIPAMLKPLASKACITCASLVVVASCASITHSMDYKGMASKGGSHADMEHRDMNHGENDHAGMGHDAMDAADTPDHKMKEGHGHGGMNHGILLVPVDQPQPDVTLTVEPDAMRGWNLHAAVSNFAFAPERVNQTSVVTEGHAHLYINGEKITRLYSAWYYIPELPPGEHEIRVELNANGHEALMSGEEAIADTVTVKVSEN